MARAVGLCRPLPRRCPNPDANRRRTTAPRRPPSAMPPYELAVAEFFSYLSRAGVALMILQPRGSQHRFRLAVCPNQDPYSRECGDDLPDDRAGRAAFGVASADWFLPHSGQGDFG